MSIEENMPPEAELMESMRSVGYSLETAVADLIDNSISANSKNVVISFEFSADKYVAILDNGDGMDEVSLRTAMRFAGKPPSQTRNKRDLGRFGLGLKTASLSQAKRLTVLTKQSGQPPLAAVWDLDTIERTRAWTLLWLTPSEITSLPEIDAFNNLEHGTVVIWQNLDVLLANQLDSEKALTQMMARAAEHISLVFHRYLDAGPNERVTIHMNQARLTPIDPFFTKNVGTQKKPETQVLIDGSPVTIAPYILPHLSQLSREERAASDFLKSRFRDTQGFYIYREKRLLSYGSWFRIVGKSEHAKLARVRVDTTNALDKAWKLGVTKSKIEPPAELRKALEHLVPNIVGDSKKVINRAGALAPNSSAQPLWLFRETGKHEFRLEIATENPLVAALDETLTDVQRSMLVRVFEQIELSLPISELSSRILGDTSPSPYKEPIAETDELATQLFAALLTHFEDSELAFAALLNCQPFATDMLQRERILKRKNDFLDRVQIEDSYTGTIQE